MNELLAPELLRMVERILVVLGGILAIYFGYRLFYIANVKQESSGTFKTALIEFSTSKIGPGVFFAVFGSYVLVSSLSHPIETGADADTQKLSSVAQNNRQEMVDLINTITDADDRAKALALFKEIAPPPKPPHFYGKPFN